jgi:hypothetical protein
MVFSFVESVLSKITERQNSPLAYKIKSYAMKAYGGVEV